MTIDVKFGIGQTVHFKLDTHKELQVIGYEYVEGRGLRYICADLGEFKYLYEFEIEGEENIGQIGFTLK